MVTAQPESSARAGDASRVHEAAVPAGRHEVCAALEARARAHEAVAAREHGLSSRLSSSRVVALVGAIGAVAYGFFARVGLPAYLAGGGLAALFVTLVVAHAIVITRQTRAEARLAWARAALARASESTPPGEAPAPFEPAAPAGHPYAADLDVFGPRSLFRLVSTARTPGGAAKLAGFLLAPAAVDVVAARQAAARELAARVDFRESLALEAEFVVPEPKAGAPRAGATEAVDPIVAWAEAPAAFDPATDEGRSRRRLAGLAGALVAATVGLLIAWRAGALDGLGVARYAWVATLVAQLGVFGLLRAAVAPIVELVSRESSFGRYAAALARVEAEPAFESPALRALAARLRGSGKPAAEEMASLETRLGVASVRESGILYLFIGTVLLWDLWAALALDAFRRRAGAHVRAWLEAFAELEALASLGAFAHEHPEYVFPEVTDGPPAFEAKGLAHPLLYTGRRVANDVALGARPRALVITGSNMSGKSTMLRSACSACVLAQAGAPVPAAALRMSRLEVMTSMRIADSLRDGVSHFYAELERLKFIVDRVNAGGVVLFALDEVLHGTNSRERHLGGEAIVRHLVAKGAIGFVTSHDIALAGLEADSDGAIANGHFEELVEAGKMSFDYRLKPGPVTTSNALRLMKLVGIDVALPELDGVA